MRRTRSGGVTGKRMLLERASSFGSEASFQALLGVSGVGVAGAHDGA